MVKQTLRGGGVNKVHYDHFICFFGKALVYDMLYPVSHVTMQHRLHLLYNITKLMDLNNNNALGSRSNVTTQQSRAMSSVRSRMLAASSAVTRGQCYNFSQLKLC